MANDTGTFCSVLYYALLSFTADNLFYQFMHEHFMNMDVKEVIEI